MRDECIIRTIEDSLAITIVKDNAKVLHARCAAVLILLAEGTHPDEVARLLGVHRTNIYHWKDSGNQFLKDDPEFKMKYLRCIKAIAEQEEDGWL